jgi:hypothetical protein
VKPETDKEEAHWTLFEKLLEMWDSDALVKFFYAEYERGHAAGYTAGYEAARADILADLETVAKRTKALMPPADRKPLAVTAMEPIDRSETDQSGTAETTVAGECEAPEATQVAPEPEKRTSEPRRPEERPRISHGVGRVSGYARPEGIPSNFEMCRLVLIDAGRPLTATEIRDCVKVRWWPDVPADWKSSPFGFLGSGKLKKDEDGKFILPDDKPVERKPTPQEIINAEVAKRQAPKLGPPARQDGVDFLWNGKTVTLHQREATIAVQLRAAMGKGHLDAKLLANSIGIKSEAESVMRDMVSILNPKIAEVGLRVDYFKGFGFIMKEV